MKSQSFRWSKHFKIEFKNWLRFDSSGNGGKNENDTKIALGRSLPIKIAHLRSMCQSMMIFAVAFCPCICPYQRQCVAIHYNVAANVISAEPLTKWVHKFNNYLNLHILILTMYQQCIDNVSILAEPIQIALLFLSIHLDSLSSQSKTCKAKRVISQPASNSTKNHIETILEYFGFAFSIFGGFYLILASAVGHSRLAMILFR